MDETLAGRVVHGLAKGLALLGGLVLIAVTAVTVVSVIGRTLIPFGLKPVPGDFEIVQAGMLFAIFAFLPWCHLTRGHAIVAILSDRFPARVDAAIECVMDALMLAVAVFIAWRLYEGMIDKFNFGEQTFILRYPLWWSYASGCAGAVAFALVAAYCAVRAFLNAVSANPHRPQSGASE